MALEREYPAASHTRLTEPWSALRNWVEAVVATVEGELIADNDQETIDRLWNRFVAAWFEDGRDDAKLQLLRFEPRDAQIWLNEHSLMAGVKMPQGTG